MPWSVSKDYHFSASHVLEGLPDGHQCGRLHGHNYIVRVELASYQLDDVGFVLDYGELSAFAVIVDDLDHRHLNDLFTFNPTAENLARWFAGQAIRYLPAGRWYLSRIGVSETPKTWAWWDHQPEELDP